MVFGWFLNKCRAGRVELTKQASPLVRLIGNGMESEL